MDVNVKSDSDHEVDVDSPDIDVDSSVLYVDSAEAISSLNQCLAEIGETPFLKRRAHQRHYPDQKIEKITDAMKRTLISDLIVVIV